MSQLAVINKPVNLLAKREQVKGILFHADQLDRNIDLYGNCAGSVGKFFIGEANRKSQNGTKEVAFSFLSTQLFQGAMFSTIKLKELWACSAIALDTPNASHSHTLAFHLFKSVSLVRSFKLLAQKAQLENKPIESYLITARMELGKSGNYHFETFEATPMSDERLVMCNEFLEANWQKLYSPRIINEFAVKNVLCRPLIEKFEQEAVNAPQSKVEALKKRMFEDIRMNLSDVDKEQYDEAYAQAFDYIVNGKALQA